MNTVILICGFIPKGVFMSDTKILFLDIDDTLLNRKKEITPEVKDAVRRAMDAGHRIVICTGRPVSATTRFFDQLGLTGQGCYAICYNGGVIWDCHDRRALFSMPLEEADVKYLFEKADEAGIHAQTYDSEAVICAEDDEEIQGYIERTHMPFRIDPAVPGSLTEAPIKVLMIDNHDHEKLERFRDGLADWAKGRISAFFSCPEYLEFVKEGISKGNAVHMLADMLGIPMENTVAAGDSENDIPMLREAHVGCAMANATPAAKEAANYITERDCDHSGVAEIIEKFILG